MGKVKEQLINEDDWTDAIRYALGSPGFITDLGAEEVGDYKIQSLSEQIMTSNSCFHVWEERHLFTSSYVACKKCGEEKNAGN